MTTGFAALFGIFGLAVQPVAGQVQQQLPWFSVAFGPFITAAGARLLAGRQLPTVVPKLRHAPTVTRSLPPEPRLGRVS
ncbi:MULTISPECIES: hypothetical protein [Streptomyces]|uniref:hypothetical protein n=1 Tax=Streptomyces TaxID=1883 RepID=UPI001F0B98FB|nr:MULTISPECIES: hypothetical protein [Streptomyces]